MIKKGKPSNQIKLHPVISAWVSRINKIQKEHPEFTLKQALALDKLNHSDEYPYEYD